MNRLIASFVALCLISGSTATAGMVAWLPVFPLGGTVQYGGPGTTLSGGLSLGVLYVGGDEPEPAPWLYFGPLYGAAITFESGPSDTGSGDPPIHFQAGGSFAISGAFDDHSAAQVLFSGTLSGTSLAVVVADTGRSYFAGFTGTGRYGEAFMAHDASEAPGEFIDRDYEFSFGLFLTSAPGTGFSTTPTQWQAVTAADRLIPEPASAVMLGIGLAALAITTRTARAGSRGRTGPG